MAESWLHTGSICQIVCEISGTVSQVGFVKKQGLGPLTWLSITEIIDPGFQCWTSRSFGPFPGIFKEVAMSPHRCKSHHRMLQSYARHDYIQVPAILDLGNSPAVILDVGAGTGTLAKLLVEEYPKVTVFLLDLPKVLAQLQEPGRFQLRPMDLQSDWNSEVFCLHWLKS